MKIFARPGKEQSQKENQFTSDSILIFKKNAAANKVILRIHGPNVLPAPHFVVVWRSVESPLVDALLSSIPSNGSCSSSLRYWPLNMAAGLTGRNVCSFCSHRLAFRPLYQPPPSKKLHLNSHVVNNEPPPLHKQREDVRPSNDNTRWIDTRLMSLGEKLERHTAESLKRTTAGCAPEGQKTGEADKVITQSSASAGTSESVQTRQSITQQDSKDFHSKDFHKRQRRMVAMCLDLFDIGGQPLSSERFRKALLEVRDVGEKAVRRVISEQLLRCQTPQAILKSVTVLMHQPWTAKQLANSSQPIARSIYRSRNNATDERALATISIIVLSLKKANLPVHHELLILGAKFAARARSLGGMKRFLKDFKASKRNMTKGNFRAIIVCPSN